MDQIINIVKKYSRIIFGISCLILAIFNVVHILITNNFRGYYYSEYFYSYYILLSTMSLIPVGILSLCGKKKSASIIFGALLGFELVFSILILVGTRYDVKIFQLIFCVLEVLSILAFAFSREEGHFSNILNISVIGLILVMSIMDIVFGIIVLFNKSIYLLGYVPLVDYILLPGRYRFVYIAEFLLAPIIILFGYIYLYDNSLEKFGSLSRESQSINSEF